MADFAADDFPAIARRLREIEAERARPVAVEVCIEIAAGAVLDGWGALFDCPRRLVEPDAAYRERIATAIADIACPKVMPTDPVGVIERVVVRIG